MVSQKVMTTHGLLKLVSPVLKTHDTIRCLTHELCFQHRIICLRYLQVIFLLIQFPVGFVITTDR